MQLLKQKSENKTNKFKRKAVEQKIFCNLISHLQEDNKGKERFELGSKAVMFEARLFNAKIDVIYSLVTREYIEFQTS